MSVDSTFEVPTAADLYKEVQQGHAVRAGHEAAADALLKIIGEQAQQVRKQGLYINLLRFTVDEREHTIKEMQEKLDKAQALIEKFATAPQVSAPRAVAEGHSPNCPGCRSAAGIPPTHDSCRTGCVRTFNSALGTPGWYCPSCLLFPVHTTLS